MDESGQRIGGMMPFRWVSLLRLVLLAALPLPAQAAERDRLEAFLHVTGYDVVIESLQQSAMAGPGMVGDAPEAFGRRYSDLAQEVFAPEAMVARALDILEAVMPDDLVNAGAEFYASDLGQRLVAVENAGHMAPDAVRLAEGQALVEGLIEIDPGRLETLRALGRAVDRGETGLRAMVEIQLRFLLAAERAGALPRQMPEDDLRETLLARARTFSSQMEFLGIAANAYVYRDIPDDDLSAYLAALETPWMQRVYEVLNATQFQVMQERYEALGMRLAGLQPEEEL